MKQPETGEEEVVEVEEKVISLWCSIYLIQYSVLYLFILNTGNRFFSIGKYPYQRGPSKIEILRLERTLLTHAITQKLYQPFHRVETRRADKLVLCPNRVVVLLLFLFHEM